MFPLKPDQPVGPWHRPARIFLATSLLLVLGACASIQDIPPGAPISDVQARFGSPTTECPQPDGSRRMVWSSQPMGQFAWSTVVDPQGSIGAMEQVLTDTAFKKVQLGSWTQEQLVCAFGPPAEISAVGLPSVRKTVWSYRYRQANVWNSLMHFYLSDNGVIERMHPGPDPMYERPDLMFF